MATHILHSHWLRKLESIIEKMVNPETGIQLKTVQGLGTKFYAVFSGSDMFSWLNQNFRTVHDAAEVLHLANMMLSHGYIIPVENQYVTVKNDSSLFRMQAKRFWLSQEPEPDNSDYAVYLVKRSLQDKSSLELDEYESENLHRLQVVFSKKWAWITMQAESQLKIDKKKDKIEKKAFDSQERAFWDLHRPPPGVVNALEVDIRRVVKSSEKAQFGHVKGCPEFKGTPEQILSQTVEYLNKQVERNRYKISKCAEQLSAYYEAYKEFDPLITPNSGNPWINTENSVWFDGETSKTNVPSRRYQRWPLSIRDLLQDDTGKEEFRKFLQKEVSAENLDFLMAVKELKMCPAKAVKTKVAEIYVEFMVDGAQKGINVDALVADVVRQNVVSQPNRYSFDAAQDHIYNLMRNDSYKRYIRSEEYTNFVTGMKKLRSVSSLGSKLSFLGLNNKSVNV